MWAESCVKTDNSGELGHTLLNGTRSNDAFMSQHITAGLTASEMSFGGMQYAGGVAAHCLLLAKRAPIRCSVFSLLSVQARQKELF